MRRELVATCAGARSGTNAETDRPDVVATRRGDRYVWVAVEHPELGKLELTLWADGRWTLELEGGSVSTLRPTDAGPLAAGRLEPMVREGRRH